MKTYKQYWKELVLIPRLYSRAPSDACSFWDFNVTWLHLCVGVAFGRGIRCI